MFDLQNASIHVGKRIRVRACKTDGTVYRSWTAIVESADAEEIVTVSFVNDPIEDLKRGVFLSKHALRAYYWMDKFYNLIEVFDKDGALTEIYINVASPPEIGNEMLSFKDHELDVSKIIPDSARLVDEDEFAEAIVKYQYTEEFQRKLHGVAREALDLAERWQAKPFPSFGENHE